MKGVVRWTGGEDIEGIAETGIITPMHGEVSASPMQIVLQAHGACSLVDIIGGLKQRMGDVRAMWIELDSERREEPPRSFTAVRMRYIIEGDVPEKLVRRLIEQSHAKYCSVGAMISGSGASVEWELEIRP